MKRGLTIVSYLLALGGAWALFSAAGGLAVVGVILLIWGNSVYEASKNTEN